MGQSYWKKELSGGIRMTTLFVDHREFRSKVPEHLKEMGLKFEIKKNQEVGDYVIANNDVAIGTERKSAIDYLRSLADGRLNNQLYQLSTHFDYSIMAIEGDLLMAAEETDLHINALFSSLAGTLLRRSPDGRQGVLSIVPTMSQMGTAKLVYYLHKKITSDHGLVRLPHLMKIKVNENERATSMLSCCPKVGDIRSRDILKDQKNLQNVANSSIKELMITKGVGKIIAENIYDVFNRDYEEDEK